MVKQFIWHEMILRIVALSCQQKEAPQSQLKVAIAPETTPTELVVAKYDFLAREPEELSFSKVFILYYTVITFNINYIE